MCPFWDFLEGFQSKFISDCDDCDIVQPCGQLSAVRDSRRGVYENNRGRGRASSFPFFIIHHTQPYHYNAPDYTHIFTESPLILQNTMPRRPPRPLCLPELVSNPQTRADFVLANPPKYGSSSSHSSLYTDSGYPRAPPSPTSTNDADSHRASGATLASLTSPVTAASSRTSLSVHNVSSHGDPANSIGIGDGRFPMRGTAGTSTEGKSWGLGRLSLGGVSVASQKSRASWSTAFVTTKSWFGGSNSSESAETGPSTSSQKEIKCVRHRNVMFVIC